MPPPPPPPSGPSFHTCSCAGCVAASVIVVPPTASTYGWLASSVVETGFCPGCTVDFAVYFFAGVAAGVAGGVQERLPLRGRLLEEVALGLLDARLAVLRLLLARLAPARGDDLVAVFVDHRRDLREFAGERFRGLVHVDARAGRHRGDVLDVEDRLAFAGPLRRAPFDRDHAEAADHARRGGCPEVAACRNAGCRR